MTNGTAQYKVIDVPQGDLYNLTNQSDCDPKVNNNINEKVASESKQNLLFPGNKHVQSQLSLKCVEAWSPHNYDLSLVSSINGRVTLCKSGASRV